MTYWQLFWDKETIWSNTWHKCDNLLHASSQSIRLSNFVLVKECEIMLLHKTITKKCPE